MVFVPKPIPIRYDLIEKAADDFRAWMRSRFGIKRRIGDDVFGYLRQMVKALGGTIRVLSCPSPLQEIVGSLQIAPGGERFMIRLSSATSVYQDNLTVAHEIGHFVLHYPHSNSPDETVHFARYGSSPVEWQANRFAAALLMPKGEFNAKRRAFDDETPILSAYFEVSAHAVEIRKENLH
jgi:hypothetical protein